MPPSTIGRRVDRIPARRAVPANQRAHYPLRELQLRCAGRYSEPCPPLARGVRWSAVSGSCGSVHEPGFRQSQHVVSPLRTRVSRRHWWSQPRPRCVVVPRAGSFARLQDAQRSAFGAMTTPHPGQRRASGISRARAVSSAAQQTPARSRARARRPVAHGGLVEAATTAQKPRGMPASTVVPRVPAGIGSAGRSA